MSTRIRKIKLAVLSVGILFLFSCTAGATGGSAFLNSSVFNKRFEKAGERAKKEAKNLRANEVLKGAMIPFFFGTVEATLR